MYVCGMTVYDYCHLGHARVMVVFDMVYRWLQSSGYDVTYVRNITDIDDKIIKRSIENGETIQQLTDRFIAFMHEDAWSEALRPALSDRQGRAMFISTPKGRNWFWRSFQRGLDEHNDEWMAWSFPTSDNPYIPDSEIEAARAGIPDRIFRQEYLAEFIDDAGGVFRGVMAAATALPGTPPASCVFGVDWGKHNDFTVVVVMGTDGTMLAMDRFNQIDYTVQAGRLMALAEKWKPVQVIAESNSMGEPIIERLQRDGLPVVAFHTSNATKAAAIDALALAFERSTIQILNDPVLVGELQAYEMERLSSGMMRYNAPAGMHDDCVMSLALAWQGVVYDTDWSNFDGLGTVDDYRSRWT
jgi:hypothetical protein